MSQNLVTEIFASATALEKVLDAAPGPDAAAVNEARERQDRLTKPPGALGRLEDLAVWLAGWQGTVKPTVAQVQVAVFAGNHGVTAQGVSPYPSDVTAQMVANFERGGAAINALSDAFGYDMVVVPMDLERPTRDISAEPAMTEDECLSALNRGAATVDANADLLVLGEMGIGNTTIASALGAVVCGGGGADWAGPGTGLDARGVANKAAVIDRALALHKADTGTAFEILRRLGGREVAAIAGAIMAARLVRLPVVLDGFVVTAAAAALTKLGPTALDHCVAGHRSAEPSHRRMLEALGFEPLLDLGMRLGEGTGAALAVQVLRAAVASHGQMATFDEAGVSDRDEG